jgi:hypothetical protein
MQLDLRFEADQGGERKSLRKLLEIKDRSASPKDKRGRLTLKYLKRDFLSL